MLRVLVASVLIMGVMANVERCPGGFPSPINETKCFMMVSERKSYGQAVKACMAMPNYNLAEISDPLENDELEGRGAAISEVYFWIGLVDVDGSGKWEWLNGRKLGYRNWERNNWKWFPTRKVLAQCVALNTLTGTWENHDCGRKYPYFCSNQQYEESKIFRKLSVLLRAKSR
ncbi:unnamed protein product [Anisakis simplex]|uniref:C-type lectin domain-containing protein n=1 Tax=Anisakis simplex TaxID=6269 RepID=A0A0M3K4E6_ANISI|nr:unnamed protein product [Anisakis simplex]